MTYGNDWMVTGGYELMIRTFTGYLKKVQYHGMFMCIGLYRNALDTEQSREFINAVETMRNKKLRITIEEIEVV